MNYKTRIASHIALGVIAAAVLVGLIAFAVAFVPVVAGAYATFAWAFAVVVSAGIALGVYLQVQDELREERQYLLGLRLQAEYALEDLNSAGFSTMPTR